MSPRHDLGPKPALGYTQSRLDRAAERRTNVDGVRALADSPTAGFYVTGGELVVLRKSAPLNGALFSQAEARALGAPQETVMLGLSDGAARFAVGLSLETMEALKLRDNLFVTDLRSIAVQGLVEAEHLPPLAEAKAVLGWHARHRFCSNCGAPTVMLDAGWRRNCPNCKTQHFPRTDPVVIMLIVDGDNCLLGRSPRFPPTMWSCLAGFVEPGESIEDAVRRETREEAGITCGGVNYFASQPWPFPYSLMIGCHAEAKTRDITVDRTELEDARWFSKYEVLTMFKRQHKDGLTAPVHVAIAHHIMRAWVEDDISFQ